MIIKRAKIYSGKNTENNQLNTVKCVKNKVNNALFRVSMNKSQLTCVTKICYLFDKKIPNLYDSKIERVFSSKSMSY